MRESRSHSIGRARPVHPHAWLWEPLSRDPTFVIRPMFGTKAVYLAGKLMFCFCAREEPWRGILVGTSHEQHASLIAEFPELAPHSILPKWLYLPETADHFERTGSTLVALAQRRDPRLGVTPKVRKKRAASKRTRPRP